MNENKDKNALGPVTDEERTWLIDQDGTLLGTTPRRARRGRLADWVRTQSASRPRRPAGRWKVNIPIEQARRLFAEARGFYTGNPLWLPVDSEIRTIARETFGHDRASVLSVVCAEIFLTVATTDAEARIAALTRELARANERIAELEAGLREVVWATSPLGPTEVMKLAALLGGGK